MFLFQTPDTSGYSRCYAIAFGATPSGASLFIRYRNLNRDISMLEQMDKEI
jgi:hypothetical protein